MNKSILIFVLAFIALFFVSVTHAYETVSSEEYSSEVAFGSEENSSINISPQEASAQLLQSLSSESLTSGVGLSAAGFAYARNNLFGGVLSQSQVDNINAIIAASNRLGVTDIRQVAYLLATTLHETAHTMRPVGLFFIVYIIN